MDKNDLIRYVDLFAGRKVVVWGDFVLDEHLYGTTRRISREAPVLILNYKACEYSLGGAGNAIQNLKALGAEPVPVGVVGRDEAGRKILSLLKAAKISTDLIFQEKEYPTPLKTRILAGEDNTRKQQILRIDREGKVPGSADLKRRIRKALTASLRGASALLVSDYDYFTVQEDVYADALGAARSSGIPVTVDSRFRLLAFKGATIATPNESEVEGTLNVEIGGDETILRSAATRLLKALQSPALLVTRGSRGMTLFEKGRPPHSIPVSGTTDIVDVTGAGDTVISIFTLAVASGASFREAAELANYAGGIVVMKKGAAVFTPAELKQAIRP